MKVLSTLLMYLLLSPSIFQVNGFWSPFKHKNEHPIRISKKNEITELKEITWDDGEVAWENMQEYYDENQTYVVKKRPLIISPPLYKSTPLYEAIEMDQTRIASISAIVRTTYRETFSVDTVISELNNKIANHYANIPAEIFVISFLTGLAIVYNKTNETEKERLEKLYILTEPDEYYEKYKRMKRLSMIAIIVLSCLTSRNVQPAE